MIQEVTLTKSELIPILKSMEVIPGSVKEVKLSFSAGGGLHIRFDEPVQVSPKTVQASLDKESLILEELRARFPLNCAVILLPFEGMCAACRMKLLAGRHAVHVHQKGMSHVECAAEVLGLLF